MKPANFPERKRRRQIRALAGMKPFTTAGVSNSGVMAILEADISAGSQRDKRSKIDRTARSRFVRAS